MQVDEFSATSQKCRQTYEFLRIAERVKSGRLMMRPRKCMRLPEQLHTVG